MFLVLRYTYLNLFSANFPLKILRGFLDTIHRHNNIKCDDVRKYIFFYFSAMANQG